MTKKTIHIHKPYNHMHMNRKFVELRFKKPVIIEHADLIIRGRLYDCVIQCSAVGYTFNYQSDWYDWTRWHKVYLLIWIGENKRDTNIIGGDETVTSMTIITL